MIEYYLTFILIMSLVTSMFYIVDKSRAIKHKWRIKEKVLLTLSMFGGALGAIITMYLIRHKNRHWYFVVINFLSLILQIILFLFILKKM